MRSFLLFLMCILCPTLYARNITYFCKKALHKSRDHSFSCIDYVYVINQKKDINKFRMLKKAFQKYDITPYRFDAVNPFKFSYKTLSNIGFKLDYPYYQMEGLLLTKAKRGWMLHEYYMDQEGSTYFHTQMTIAGIARNLDFLSVIFDAYKNNYEVAWIMTDDARIVKNPNLLTGYVCQLSEEYPDWDLLYTDMETNSPRPMKFDSIAPPLRPAMEFGTYDDYKTRETDTYPIAKLGLRSGAYSFLISKRGMRKIINYYKENKFYIPFEIEVQTIKKLKAFVLKDEVVSN